MFTHALEIDLVAIINDRFGLNSRYLGRVPKTVVRNYSTRFQLDQINDFFAEYPDAGAGTRSRIQALEDVQNNIKWLDTHYQDIENWLNDRIKE